MPIVDVISVSGPDGGRCDGGAQAIADAIGRALGAEPGRVWVRLAVWPASDYAENDVVLADYEWPVFVTVLHASPPQGEARACEVATLTAAVAQCLRRPAERVHLEYAPPGAGRIAFGGRLVPPQDGGMA